MIYTYIDDINNYDDFANLISTFRKRLDYYGNIKIKIYNDIDDMLIDSFNIDKIYIDIVDAYNNIIDYKKEYQDKIAMYFTIDMM